MDILLLIVAIVLICLLTALAWWGLSGQEVTAPPIPMEPNTDPVPADSMPLRTN